MSTFLSKNLKWNYIYQYGYTLTNILNSLILLPFYVKYIGKDELGIWWATGNVLTWLTMVDPGVGDVIQQRIAKQFGNKKTNELSFLISSGIFSSILISLASLAIGALFFYNVELITGFNFSRSNDLKYAFIISIGATSISLFTFCLSGINQGFLKSKTVAIIFILGNLLFFFVNILLLINNFELISIALANFIRALFLLSTFCVSTFLLLRNLNLHWLFNTNYFFSFIKVFGYTSISKIVTTFSTSIDLLILAKFTSPSLISLFEINRRPIKLLQGLVGRYSVALMPSISFNADDKSEVQNLIISKFNFFLTILFVLISLIVLNYEELILIWIGSGNYIGDENLVMMAISFLFSVSGYFISNIIFALGDFKSSSMLNIIKGIFTAVIAFFSTKYYGIQGLLISTMVTSLIFEFVIFYFRIKKMGYSLFNAINVFQRVLFSVCAILLCQLMAIYMDSWLIYYQLFFKSILFFMIYGMFLLAIEIYNRYFKLKVS